MASRKTPTTSGVGIARFTRFFLALAVALLIAPVGSSRVVQADDGQIDPLFGIGGKVRTDFFGKACAARAVAIQPDGKIVAEGTTGDKYTRADFAIARYDNAASFDVCISDDSSGDLFQFNSTTGDYKFTACGANLILSGRGAVNVKGCKTTLKSLRD